MPESEPRWSEVQEKAEEPLKELLQRIKEAASNFGPFPEDELDRQQFAIRLGEAATDWARSATDIYSAALTDSGYRLTPFVMADAWCKGLDAFLQHRIRPQIEAAIGFNEEDALFRNNLVCTRRE